jgi:riboflavin synthase alpha subunit
MTDRNEQTTTDKPAYETPVLTKHGKLDELTHGSGSVKVDGQSLTVQN